MKLAVRTLCKKTNASARVVDGKLILSFPEALTPILWQMDLTQARASALEVREDKSNSQFVLTLRTSKLETLDIAPFATKAEAVEALMAAAKALENAQGQIRPVSVVAESASVSAIPASQKKGRWGAIALAILMIVVLLGLWSMITPVAAPNANNDSSTAQQGNFTGQTDDNGVPLSADAFLMKKRQ